MTAIIDPLRICMALWGPFSELCAMFNRIKPLWDSECLIIGWLLRGHSIFHELLEKNLGIKNLI